MTQEVLSKESILQRLNQVIDPELGVSIVKMGLIYQVKINPDSTKKEEKKLPKLEITMTLTTPGCPLSAVFDTMVRDALHGLPGIDPDHDVSIHLTFDPPWVPDMMDEETKAELGFD